MAFLDVSEELIQVIYTLFTWIPQNIPGKHYGSYEQLDVYAHVRKWGTPNSIFIINSKNFKYEINWPTQVICGDFIQDVKFLYTS